jgi:uncharacterized membrane protein
MSEFFENVGLLVVLMALGIGVTVAVLIWFAYFLETME